MGSTSQDGNPGRGVGGNGGAWQAGHVVWFISLTGKLE